MVDNQSSERPTQVEQYLKDGKSQEAVSLAVELYGPELYGFVRSMVRDPQRADDIHGQVWADIWCGLASYRGTAGFRAWAYGVARNAIRREARDPYQRKAHALAECPQLEEWIERTRTRTAPHLRTDAKQHIRALRDQLSQEEQSLLVLRVDRNLSWTEVAHAMSISSALCRKRFERLVKKLRRLGQESGALDVG